MKKSLLLSATAALTLTSALSAAASHDEQQIRATYAKLERGLKSRDLSAVEALEAPNYTESAMGKTMNRQQANAQMQQEFATLNSIKSFIMKLTSIHVNGKSAHATTSFSMAASFQGQGGKSHSLKVAGTTAEELVKSNGGWLFKSTKDTGHHTWIDGKEQKM